MNVLFHKVEIRINLLWIFLWITQLSTIGTLKKQGSTSSIYDGEPKISLALPIIVEFHNVAPPQCKAETDAHVYSIFNFSTILKVIWPKGFTQNFKMGGFIISGFVYISSALKHDSTIRKWRNREGQRGMRPPPA